MLFLLGAMELERSKSMRFAGFFERLGDWSYSIYLSRLFVVAGLGRLMGHLFPHSHYAILFLFPIAVATAIFIGFLSYTLIERPMIDFFYKGSSKRSGGITKIRKAELEGLR